MARAEQLFEEIRQRGARQAGRLVAICLGIQILLAITSILLEGALLRRGTLAISLNVVGLIALGVRAGARWTPFLAAASLTLSPDLLSTSVTTAYEPEAIATLTVLLFYRDWRVIACGAVTLLLGAAAWAHLGLVSTIWILVFVPLLVGVARLRAREREEAAVREATLEHTAREVQHKVDVRSRAFKAQSERYKALVENTEAVPFEYDLVRGKMTYVAPQAERMFGASLENIKQPGFFASVTHPDDVPTTREALRRFARGERASSEPIDSRVLTTDGIVHVRTFLSAFGDTTVTGFCLDITRQMFLEQELRQAQKLESIGRLSAGIAHEINTPVQYVNDSLVFIGEGIEELLEFVRVLHEQPAGSVESARALAKAEAALDLEYLRAELPAAVARASDGSARIAAIVKSMKIFAHSEHHTTSAFDLRQAIESMLTIASSEYRLVADVETRFEDVPLVMCHGGEISQVILNLVVNAGHAIAEVMGDSPNRGLIRVRLWRDHDDAIVSIRDSGPGMTPEVQQRMFDPFFTTKAVGKGSGQGLSVARTLVEKHHGKLTCESILGEGATFHVRLPIHDRPAARVGACPKSIA